MILPPVDDAAYFPVSHCGNCPRACWRYGAGLHCPSTGPQRAGDNPPAGCPLRVSGETHVAGNGELLYVFLITEARFARFTQYQPYS
jgi:hypothetical protein